MDRKTDIRRDSRPASPELFRDENEKANLEAKNGLRQFDEVLRLIDEATKPGALFRLRPSTMQGLHRIAIENIYTCAGNYRNHPVYIAGTSHEPPPWQQVAAEVEACCDYVDDNWNQSPIHLSAYLMWRINWIHPFSGGNGRTSRAVSYLTLCARLGYRLPGTLTIPEQIVSNRQPYYEALDAADLAWSSGVVDVSVMEKLLDRMLATQLVQVHAAAVSGPHTRLS